MISRPEGGQDANVPVDAQIVDYNLLQIWNEINYKK